MYKKTLYSNDFKLELGHWYEENKEMAAKPSVIKPIISKIYCSSSQAVLVVRRRPHVINGGGFVVTDCSQKVAFRVDGCGILGTKDEMILRDGDGDALLLIRRKVYMYKFNHAYIYKKRHLLFWLCICSWRDVGDA